MTKISVLYQYSILTPWRMNKVAEILEDIYEFSVLNDHVLNMNNISLKYGHVSNWKVSIGSGVHVMAWSKQATNHNLQPEPMMDKSRDTWHHGKSLGHNVFMNYRYTSQNNTAVRLLNFLVYSKYLSPPPAPQPLPSNPLLLPYMQNPHMVIVPADVSPPDGARPSACTAPVANIWSVLCQSFPGLGDIESPLLTRWHNLK